MQSIFTIDIEQLANFGKSQREKNNKLHQITGNAVVKMWELLLAMERKIKHRVQGVPLEGPVGGPRVTGCITLT